MDDLISRQAAIDALYKEIIKRRLLDDVNDGMLDEFDTETILRKLPSAQIEQPTGVQDVLQYLDEYLHPIVSPEHWSVYSELYDMISMLPSAQSEQKKGKWIDARDYCGEFLCSNCHALNRNNIYNYCPNCGAEMEER